MATASNGRTAPATRTRSKAPTPLTESQWRDFFALIKGADSVELKLTVPESDHRSAVRSLGMDPLNAQIRQVFFYDTPDLRLNAAGLVVRSRRVQGKGGDTVIKLRPVQPESLSREMRKNPSVVVEVDAMPGGFVCSASFKGVTGINDPRDVSFGNATIKSLFSKDQKAFYRAHAPEGLDLNDLVVLGPITLLKGKFSLDDFDRPIVAEMWLYPDGSRILELSTKALPGEAWQKAAEIRLALRARGINLTGEQQTKTKTALDYFAKLAKDAAAEAAAASAPAKPARAPRRKAPASA
jgi:hypothetical protein